jgi:hypothetical protein
MNTAGAIELGYASAAIVGALLERLVAAKAISADDATGVLDDAIVSLQSLGHLASIPGAIRVVGDVRAELAKHSVG